MKDIRDAAATLGRKACIQCHRVEEPRGASIRAIRLNRSGLCAACVNHNDEVAAEDRSKAAALLGRLGGSISTDAKATASRENGKKGGRPKGAKNREKPRVA